MKHSLLETALGAIVLASALVFLVFSYSTAHKGDADMSGGSYHIIGLFDNIGGLKIGDTVVISGVKVGDIRDIVLDPKLYRARVVLDVSRNVQLSRDTTARIASEGLLGGKYLELLPGGETDDLQDGDTLSMTQSATNLEDLLGRFIFNASSDKKGGGTSPAQGASTPTEAAPAPSTDEPAHP